MYMFFPSPPLQVTASAGHYYKMFESFILSCYCNVMSILSCHYYFDKSYVKVSSSMCIITTVCTWKLHSNHFVCVCVCVCARVCVCVCV